MMIRHVRIPVVMAAFVLMTIGVVASAADSLPMIRGLEAETGASGVVIHLRATGEIETVHYSPQPGVWIVEMSEAGWDEHSAVLEARELGIERAELSHVDEFGKRVSRLTVWLSEPARLELTPVSEGLDLEFLSLQPVSEDTAVAGQPLTREADPVERPEETALAVLPAVTVDRTPPPTAQAGSLLSVIPTRSSDGVVVELRGDGALPAQAYLIENPDRLVVDLTGVINRVRQHVFAVNSYDVRQVRVAQFRAAPVPITRVVVDLDGPAPFDVSETSTGAVITVGDVGTPTIAIGDEVRRVAHDSGTISIEAAPDLTDRVPSTMFDTPEASPAVVASYEPPPETAARDAQQSDRSPFVADPSQLIERAPAAQVLDPDELVDDEFVTTEVSTEEQQFTGEPITLTLKDADIKDVLRTFSALTQLNIVLDPSVSGSVTVELREVPWDQALDLILRINGLDYVLENNVLRVAPISKLAQEKAQKAAFDVEKERAKPLKTIVKPLSYAKADYVASLLTSESYLLSDRGSVVVDDRTNKLIIRDVTDRVDGILRLIETLDQPTPQVVIEGRIVETTREFSRELGVVWGFQATMDAAHGNDTGLEFPNSVDVVGAVDLPTGQFGTLGFTFADILNTFNLDFLLTAAESDGTAKIVSTPRVTTQNLQQAYIRSGFKIPVQTVANNTVTVQYVDATLRLEVTPQITAEGTVNMEIDIRKQEPQLAFAIVGGQNVPILTRDAATQLLVRDGGTTVIGGIYQINEEESEDRVPGLHKLPVLGSLFKNRLVRSRHDELLIFITPRIVKY
jgi:type IV pilus assembly protein PilQ